MRGAQNCMHGLPWDLAAARRPIRSSAAAPACRLAPLLRLPGHCMAVQPVAMRAAAGAFAGWLRLPVAPMR